MKVLIDEKKARKIAEDFNLDISGTIGFLLKAYQEGLVQNAYEKVQKLKDLGFYISQQLLDELKKLLMMNDKVLVRYKVRLTLEVNLTFN